MEVLSDIIRRLLLPIISEVVSEIFKRYKVDANYVNELNDASEKYRTAKTSEEKKQARIALIKLTSK